MLMYYMKNDDGVEVKGCFVLSKVANYCFLNVSKSYNLCY